MLDLSKVVKYDKLPIGPDNCPVFIRWRVKLFDSIAISVHQFLQSSPPEIQHNHSWWFVTLVLKGKYIDVSAKGRQVMRAGRIAFRSAEHRHSVEDCEGCWTLVLTGPTVPRPPQFWVGGDEVGREEFERVEGMICE